MSRGCGTVIAIIHDQKDDVRSSDPHNVIQEAAMNAENKLFQPVKFGPIELTNRIVMAPMTRSRASESGVSSDLTVTYSAQRALAGLIITNAKTAGMS
jgi:hypothetical protein